MLNKREGFHSSGIGWPMMLMITGIISARFLSSTARLPIASAVVYMSVFMLVFYAFVSKPISKVYLFIPFVMIANEVVASFWGIGVFGQNTLMHIYSPVGFGLMMVACLGVDWSSSVTKSDVHHVFMLIFIAGIFSCLYAMTVQANVVRENLAGGWWGYRYTSFLGHRNNFSGFLVMSIISALYLWQNSNKIIYPACIALFMFNIIMTDSRNGFYATVLLFGLYFAFSNNIPIKALVLMSIPVIVIIAVIGFNFSGIERAFAHKGGHFEGGNLEGESRFLMWSIMLAKLWEHGAFLSGFGSGSQAIILRQDFRVSNAHNAFVNLIFDGGIIKLSVYIMALALIYRNIIRHPDTRYRNLMKATFWSVMFYTMFDTSSMVFGGFLVSFLDTIILAVLPWYRE